MQQFRAQKGITRNDRSGSDGLFDDLIPHLESDGGFGSVVDGSHAVAGWAEVRGDTTERGQKPLGYLRCLYSVVLPTPMISAMSVRCIPFSRIRCA